jgi:alpha-1,3-mannosyl-glycoprotein beta-1,2-N-acetylglucosaminyltransferase
VSLIQQPDQSDIQVPPKEKKFKGYFKIARHYGWALNQMFFNFNFSTVIIVEGLDFMKKNRQKFDSSFCR